MISNSFNLELEIMLILITPKNSMTLKKKSIKQFECAF